MHSAYGGQHQHATKLTSKGLPNTKLEYYIRCQEDVIEITIIGSRLGFNMKWALVIPSSIVRPQALI